MQARLTITTTDTINAIQKGGTGSFNEEEIMTCVDTAFGKGKEIRKILTKRLKTPFFPHYLSLQNRHTYFIPSSPTSSTH